MVLANVKTILTNVFKIALTAQHRPEEAVRAFSTVLDELMKDERAGDVLANAVDLSSISGDSATSDVVDVEPPVPANSPAGPTVKCESNIELKVEEAPNAVPSTIVLAEEDRLSTNQLEEHTDAEAEDECVSDDQAAAEVEDDESADDDSADAEAADVEDADEDDSDSYLERLEVVRIRKVLYWKDTETGDLYAYMPEDEVGDKVGKIVDGKAVFDE